MNVHLEDGVVVVDVGHGERGRDAGGAGERGRGGAVVRHQDDQRVGRGGLAVQGLGQLDHAVGGHHPQVVVGVAADEAVGQPVNTTPTGPRKN